MSKVVADLHLHSSYARATSKDLNFDTLVSWAKLKGINLLSSADFTHPIWAKETQAKLKDKGNGFFSYQGFDFILGAEVSCIFSQGGRLRRVHLLLYVPSWKALEKVNQELGKRGKLASDGRPILGLSARNVLELLLEADPNSIMIPAHAWTPWFGVLGQNGGFDSLEECFGDLSQYIYAVETGLSSDPEMNWRVPELDSRSIVSFSDAHSAPKMGRELTIFDMNDGYLGLLEALKKQSIAKTIEFYPEEGKYHYNGHRNCDFKETPSQTVARESLLCPICKRPLTIGVMHRVQSLADKKRPEGYQNSARPQFSKLVPLQEVIAESHGLPHTSPKVRRIFLDLVPALGSELDILEKHSLEDLTKQTNNQRLVEAIDRVRSGNIHIDPGYDGVYGVVEIWQKEKGKKTAKVGQITAQTEPIADPENQLNLFENLS